MLLNADEKPRTVFHGTPKQFDRFKLGPIRRGMQLGFGVHFAECPDFALQYAGDNGRLIACHLHADRVLDVSNIVLEGSETFEFARDLHKRCRKSFSVEEGMAFVNLDRFDPKTVQAAMQRSGYDGIRYISEMRTISGMGCFTSGPSSIAYVVLDPDQAEIVEADVKPQTLASFFDTDELWLTRAIMGQVGWFCSERRVSRPRLFGEADRLAFAEHMVALLGADLPGLEIFSGDDLCDPQTHRLDPDRAEAAGMMLPRELDPEQARAMNVWSMHCLRFGNRFFDALEPYGADSPFELPAYRSTVALARREPVSSALFRLGR